MEKTADSFRKFRKVLESVREHSDNLLTSHNNTFVGILHQKVICSQLVSRSAISPRASAGQSGNTLKTVYSTTKRKMNSNELHDIEIEHKINLINKISV